MRFDITSTVNIAIILAGIVAAAIYIRAGAGKQRATDAEELADTRGEKIKDLEKEVHDMRRELDTLRGQMVALQALKATEIADEVVNRLAKVRGVA